MRSLLFVVLSSCATLAVAQNQTEQMDKATQDRVRTEGSVGGTRETKPEEREGADAGAGPHRQFPRGGQSKREHDERSSERDAGRGASAGRGVQSGDERPGSSRP